jgi:hypothetical protein
MAACVKHTAQLTPCQPTAVSIWVLLNQLSAALLLLLQLLTVVAATAATEMQKQAAVSGVSPVVQNVPEYVGCVGAVMRRRGHSGGVKHVTSNQLHLGQQLGVAMTPDLNTSDAETRKHPDVTASDGMRMEQCGIGCRQMAGPHHPVFRMLHVLCPAPRR